MSTFLDAHTGMDTLKTVGGLEGGTEYYWRVIVQSSDNGNYRSRARRFTTIDLSTYPPVLASPPDSSMNQERPVMIVWRRAARSRAYRIQVAANPIFTPVVVDNAIALDTVRSIGGLADSVRYYWRVQSTNDRGESYWSTTWSFVTKKGQPEVPASLALYQNYPNPFNPSTTITFSLPYRSFVTLKIFDVMGREVSTLISGELSEGSHSRTWNATGQSSGVYYYRLHAGPSLMSKQLMYLK